MNIDDYTEIKECTFKDEHYSVRDNGSIMRHQRKGMHKRKYDEVWSFGTPNIATGYMIFCGERVHRIVATAFLGPAPSEQYVVDHIDTNRQNNRIENLRWLTKLENILNNEITRKKIELICGSVEAFLKDPSLLYGYETADQNFSWMRNVNSEEAKNCLENWNHWAKTASPKPNFKVSESHVGDWIFEKTTKSKQTNSFYDTREDNDFQNSSNDILKDSITERSSVIIDTEEWMNRTFGKENTEELREKDYTWNESFTPTAKQSWLTKTEFPCCPKELSKEGLEQYKNNLLQDKVFSRNYYDTYYVIDSKVVKKKNILAILSTNHKENGYYGTYSVCIVKIDNGFYLHICVERFGYYDDATHFYKVLIGEERMTEEDEIDWDI